MEKKLIGTGAFTRAYLRNDNMVELYSVDNMKECMSLGWFPDSELFPEIEKIENDTVSVYEMKYYKRVKLETLEPDQLKIYRDLQKAYKKINYGKSRFNCDCVKMAFDTIENEELRETMIEALEACQNYGDDICFEISKRNIAIENGKLILLDCFFQQSTLKKVYQKWN